MTDTDIKVPGRATTKSTLNAITFMRQQQKAQIMNDCMALRPERPVNWLELEKRLGGIEVPNEFKSKIFRLDTLRDFLSLYISQPSNDFMPTVHADDGDVDLSRINCKTYGIYTLKPEQQYAVDQILDRAKLKIQPDADPEAYRILLQPGRTGAGKTVMAVALVKEMFDAHVFDAFDGPFPLTTLKVLVLTPKPVVQDYREAFIAAGLEEQLMSGAIEVTNYASMYSGRSSQYFDSEEVIDVTSDQTVITRTWHAFKHPTLVICDESHKLKNKDSLAHQALKDLARQSPYTKFLLFSATPFVTLTETNFLVTLSNKPLFSGQPVDEATFPMFTRELAKGNDPSKPNAEAIKRLKSRLGDHIVELPYVRWPSRQVNMIRMCEFENEKAKQVYAYADERWLKKALAMGKSTNHGFIQQILLGQFRKAAEPLRNHYLFDESVRGYRSGDYAPVIGCYYKSTLVDLLFRFADAGVPREHISIIWGGVTKYNPDELFSQEEMMSADMLLRTMTPAEVKKLEKSFKFMEDRIMLGESEADQHARIKRLTEFGIYGPQSADQRQAEKKAFQTGVARIALLTSGAGGTGLSLDKWNARLLDRQGYFTPLYSGPEIAQLAGRLVRRATIQPKVPQYFCYMSNTVEETSVMPKMAANLSALGALASKNFDMLDMMLSGGILASRAKRLSDEEAATLAESEDSQVIDNTQDED